MPKASVKRLIECQKDLINLVLDIEKYPQFVLCYDAKIYENKDKDDLQKIIADLTIGKGPFKDTYKSDVVFNKKDTIFVKNIDGPLNIFQIIGFQIKNELQRLLLILILKLKINF